MIEEMPNETNAEMFPLEQPAKKYKVILADPPWQFKSANSGGNMNSGAANKYMTTGIKGLMDIDVDAITEDDAILFMWYVGAMPQEAIDLVKAWGFTLKNMNGVVWNKLTQHGKPYFGMGFYTRAGSESVIIATKGKYKPKSRSVRAVIHAESQIQFESKVAKHSEKPKAVHDLILELCGDVPRLEMFARKTSPGWDVFGNEAPNSIKIGSKSDSIE